MRNKLALSLAAATLIVASSVQALPQTFAAKGHEPVGGESPWQSGAKPLLMKPEGTKAILHTMADALGLVRRASIKFPPGESIDDVNRLQIGGAGTMTDPKTKAVSKLSRYVYGFSLLNNASRLDMTLIDAGGKTSRVVEVLSDGKAWNETAPGVGGSYSPEDLTMRKYVLAIYPHAFVRAANKADPATVKIEEVGGVTTVTVPVEGTPMTATLDQDYRPSKIVVSFKDKKHGKVTLEGVYGNYRDMSEYGVMFPRDMTLKLNGVAALQVKIDDARVGPYIIFPEPTAVAGRQ